MLKSTFCVFCAYALLISCLKIFLFKLEYFMIIDYLFYIIKYFVLSIFHTNLRKILDDRQLLRIFEPYMYKNKRSKFTIK